MTFRTVYYDPKFNNDTLQFGGVAKLQTAIAALVSAIENSETFPLNHLEHESGLYYAGIKESGDMPALLVACRDDGDGWIRMKRVRRRFFDST